jgi:hypothetical protein
MLIAHIRSPCKRDKECQAQPTMQDVVVVVVVVVIVVVVIIIIVILVY